MYLLSLLQFSIYVMSVSCHLHFILRHVVTLKDFNILKRNSVA